MQGVATGFYDLDDVLCGLRPGQLVLLAARSRVGKTSLACDIIRQVAAAGNTVVFFSLEMTRQEIWERMISGQAKVNLHDLRSRAATASEAADIKKAADELAAMSIVIKDTPNTTPMSMRGFSRKIINRKGKVDLIVVDYLQCIQSGKDKQSRYELVSDVSRQMKVLARTLNVPVLALAQLNRTAEDEEPRLSHLRESGGLEQDADVVLLLNRPHVFDSEKDPTLATVDVAKHRNGPCQVVSLHFHSPSVSFQNRVPPVEDFTKPPQESPVAPPSRKKRSPWWDNNSYD
jgi:replicative DNA helicase